MVIRKIPCDCNYMNSDINTYCVYCGKVFTHECKKTDEYYLNKIWRVFEISWDRLDSPHKVESSIYKIIKEWKTKSE